MVRFERILVVFAVALLFMLPSCKNGDEQPGEVPAPNIPRAAQESSQNSIRVGDELELFVKEDG